MHNKVWNCNLYLHNMPYVVTVIENETDMDST